jgi:hypothetical protein
MRFLLGLAPAAADHAGGGDDQVLQHGQMREQVVLLEDEAHALAQRNQLVFGAQRFHGGVAHADLPLLRAQQAGDAAQDRALARTGRPDDGHGLAAPHLDIDALEHGVVAEGQVHVAA